MADGDGGGAPPLARKRKLPASLGLVPGGRARPVATATTRPNNSNKRQATQADVTADATAARRTGAASVPSLASAGAAPAAAAAALPLAPPSNLQRAVSPSSSSLPSPPLMPVQFRPVEAAALGLRSPVPTAAAAAASVPRLRFTESAAGTSAARLELSSVVGVASRPLPFDPARAARPPFPLLSLPSDVLSLVSSFCQLWDAFFLRCTCSALRLVSGMNGGANGPPLASAAQSNTGMYADGDGPDESRFWHQWNSLDFRLLLCGWREFERTRTRVARAVLQGDAAAAGAGAAASPPVINIRDVDDESPSPESPGSLLAASPRHSITIFDSDEEDGSPSAAAAAVTPSAESSSCLAAASTPAASVPLPAAYRADAYEQLRRCVAPYLTGSPRLRASALAEAGRPDSSSARRSGAAEDLASSSEEDIWLLSFLRSHRFPALSHLHFGYVTLHSPLLQHLQAYCCATAPAASGSAEADVAFGSSATPDGRVIELSLQHSERSPGLRWVDTALRGFGKLGVVSLDFTSCQRPVWPALAASMPSLSPSLTELSLLGPLLSTVSLPANVLEVLAQAVPQLRTLLLAHGLQTDQQHLIQAAQTIRSKRLWTRLRTLSLLHFPLIEAALPLLSSLSPPIGRLEHVQLRNCINVRMPVIEAVPKARPPPAAACSTSAKKKKSGAANRGDSPPSARSPKALVAGELPLQTAPRFASIQSAVLSHCASLTVPSIRSLGALFPRLTSLELSGYDSSLVGGSCLKFLMDSSVFPYLTALNLARCAHLDDRAWDALPKRTRMPRLTKLDISIGRTRMQQTSHMHAARYTAGGRVMQQADPSSAARRFTDHGLNLLLLYCPSLTVLNLSGHLHLSSAVLLRVFVRLPCIQHAMLLHLPQLDAAWLRALVGLPIAHAFTVELSLSVALLRSAYLWLESPSAAKSAGGAAATIVAAVVGPTGRTSPAEPQRLPAALLANTSNGHSARWAVAQRLQQHIAQITQQRITLSVRL